MPIQDSDYFLIDDNGTIKKIRADNLRSGYQSTHSNKKLLVNLSDQVTSKFVYAGDIINKVNDDHWMLINRGGTSYKVSGALVKQLFGGPWGIDIAITNFPEREDFQITTYGYPVLEIKSMACNEQGETYAVMDRWNNGGNDNSLMFAKVSSDGDVEWIKQLNGDGLEKTQAATVDGDGNLVFIASTNSNQVTDGYWNYDIVVGKISRSGNLDIIRKYRAMAGTYNYQVNEFPKNIFRKDNGNFLIAARYDLNSNNDVIFEVDNDLIRIDPSNDSAGVTAFSGSYPDVTEISSSMIDGSSMYIALRMDREQVGSNISPPNASNFRRNSAIFLKNTNGTTNWHKRYSPERHTGQVRPCGVAVSNGNPTFACLVSNAGYNADFSDGGPSNLIQGIALFQFDANGNFLRYVMIQNPYPDMKVEVTPAQDALVADSNGNLYVVYKEDNVATGEGNDIFITKFDTNFTQIWSRRINDDGTTVADPVGNGIAIDKSNNLVFSYGHSVMKVKSDGDFVASHPTASNPFSVQSFTAVTSTSMMGEFTTFSGLSTNSNSYPQVGQHSDTNEFTYSDLSWMTIVDLA